MPMKSAGDTPKTPQRFWIMYLFLSVFIIIGSGCLLYAPVKLVKTALFIKSAVATTGTVTDLIASRSSKSTTYAPVVTFTAPDGRLVEFRSQISSGSSAYRIGEEVAVYYDPLRPERAEIKAFTPLWMPTIILSALGLAFTGVGGGVVFAMRRARREAQEKEAAKQQGMKDWETEPAWRTGKIRSTTRQEMWFFWLFAVVWNAIAQPTGFFVIPEIIEKGNRLAAIGLLFPLVGFWLLAVAIRKTLQIRKFGEIELEMNPSPGSIGGEVGGVVELPLPCAARSVYAVALSCMHVTRQRNSTNQELIWQETGRASAAPGNKGTRISFRFALPADLPPSSSSDEGSYQWLLRLSADLPGIDLDRNFLIPVVATETPLPSTLSTPLAPSLAPAEAIPAHIVRIAKEADHLLFRYPCRRNLKSALITALVGGFFLLFCYLFSVKAAGVGSFLLPIFGLIGLALVLSSLWLFAYSLEVDAAAKEVVVVRRFFGLPLRTVLIPASALRAIETHRRGVLGSGNTAKLIFTVVARYVDGTKITIGDGIAGRVLAETIARMIAQKYGLGVPKAAPVQPLSSEIPQSANRR